MQEIRKVSEQTRVALEFAEKINSQKLPIERSDAIHFALDVQGKNAPDGFLNRLFTAFQFQSRTTFNQELKDLVTEVGSIVSDRSYIVLFTDGLSGPWIYKKLLRRGISKADKIYTITGEMVGYEREIINQASVRNQLVLIPDDFSISADQIAGNLLQGEKFDSNVHVALLRATASAGKRIARSANLHTVGPQISLLGDVLTPADLEFMSQISHDPKRFIEPPDCSGDVAFWTWYKVPDNVPIGLLGNEVSNIHPLIRETRFTQPYQ